MSTPGKPGCEHRALCRDCLELSWPRDPGQPRCRCCGSPRLVSHPERDALAIAHVDCDAFYAAVEKRDNPALRDLPLIVGGGKRGVVTTCCYLARTYGIRSAMPMFKALALCPHAHVVRPDMVKYAAVGRLVRARMQALTPLVEPLSIDEAFLDLSGTDDLHGGSPAQTLARFTRQVEAEVGITVSIGLSYCKFLAKVASDMDKPRGFRIIGRAEARGLLAPSPIGLIWGVGTVAQARLAAGGIRTVGDMQRLDPMEAARRFGDEGRRLHRLANGLDDRPVSPIRETKSVSAETTFDVDLQGAAALEPILFRLAEKVAHRLRQGHICGTRVTLKLKTSRFKVITRARSGLPPTQLAARLFGVGRDLLRAEVDGGPFRLIGLGVSELRPGDDADSGDLVDTSAGRDKAIEHAMEALRTRYGAGTIERGITFGTHRR